MMDIKKERDRIMKIEENRKILQWIRCVDPNIHSRIFRRMPSYYQHLVTPYDNREVKLVRKKKKNPKKNSKKDDNNDNNNDNKDDDNDNDDDNDDADSDDENNDDIDDSFNIDGNNNNANNNMNSDSQENNNTNEKIVIDTLGFSSQNFELNTSKSLSNNDLDVSNIANMSVYDYNDNDYKSDTDISESSKQVNHKRYNSLLPLENKQVYNVVENNKANSISSRTNSASIVKGSISADNLQKPNNKSDFVVVNTEKEKDKEKEKLKMPLMDLPSTTSLPSLSHQNSQNNFNDKIISLPSVI